MELEVAKKLISPGIERTDPGQVWADLGAGEGLFSRALLALLPRGSVVYAVDSDATALARASSIPGVIPVQGDFLNVKTLLPVATGVLMANSLHFVREKHLFLEEVRDRLLPPRRMIIVEYDRDTASAWVPYPLSYKTLLAMAKHQRFQSVSRLGDAPSRYGEFMIYSALVIL